MKIKTVFNSQGGHEYIVKMAIFNVQRAIIPKVGNPELLFMCIAHCLMMLYIHVNFHENISNAFYLQSGHEYMVEMVIFNVQRAIIPDLGNLKLWFMRSACRLMVLYVV